MSIELDFDFDKLDGILENGTRAELDSFCADNHLVIKEGRIYYDGNAEERSKFWDKYQHIRKVQLNATFGSLSNKHCRFFDKRIGQSITLSGRSIVKHMISEVNKEFTGNYTDNGETYRYGDSVTGDTILNTDTGDISIKELYDQIPYKVTKDDGKEYAVPTNTNSDLKILGYNAYEDEAVFGEIRYVMRHKTTKQLYKVTMEDGGSVVVTEDHSLIVDRDGLTLDVKPTELKDNDLIISIN